MTGSRRFAGVGSAVATCLPLLLACGPQDPLVAGAGGAGGAGGGGGGGAGGDGPGYCGPDVLAGSYFFAASIQLDPQKPFVALAELSTSANELSMTVQLLAAADRATPVGTAETAGPFPLAADGSFSATMQGVVIPVEANPIDSNSEVHGLFTLKGALCTNRVCGTIGGQITLPVPITLLPSKNSFTMVRVKSPAEYPEPPEINCEGDLADPLPL